MKTLELKKLTTPFADEPIQTLSYRAQALTCVRTPLNQQSGMDLEEMRLSLRVIEALLKATDGEWLTLEDTDMQHLQNKVRATRWNVASSLIVQFVEDIQNAAVVQTKST